MRRQSFILSVVVMVVVGLWFGSGAAARQQTPAGSRWITAWGTSQNGVGNTPIGNATVRMVARVSIGGDAVRIRLDNTYGKTPIAIGKAYVGHVVRGSALEQGSNRQISFNRSPNVTIPAGGSAVSDPLPISVRAFQDLAVSLYVPEADVRPSQHGNSYVTSYVAANGSGDTASDETGKPFATTTGSMLWLKAIDVLSATSTGAIVAFGDSITDGVCSVRDAHNRWEDWVSVRLALRDGNRAKTIVNEGIGGNTITREGLQPAPDSAPALERLERDVLSHHGVTHVIFFTGTNDLRREAPPSQVISGMQEIIKRVKARGLSIIGVTIIPRHFRAPEPDNTGWNDAKTKGRQQVNQWIRTAKPYDGLIDFDRLLQDPKNPDLIYSPFNCGDGVHPSPLGYWEMGRAVSLDLFGNSGS